MTVGASAGSSSAAGVSEARKRWTRPARTAPAIGATQNAHSCLMAQPPTNSAGPVLRAGFTEVFVTGILTRCISVKANPIAIGAKLRGALSSVAPRIMIRKKNVMTTSLINPATNV